MTHSAAADTISPVTYHLAPAIRGLGSESVDAVPPVSQLGQIRSRSGRVYQITPDDILWLARSVRYEGGNHAATAWTYAQRLMAFDSPSLMRLVQAHSQPVNPIWRRDGEKCRPGGPYHGNQEYCSDQQLARRDEASTIPWGRLPESIRRTVLDWARGKIQNPVPRATDFANAPVSQSFLSRHPDAGIVLREGNWYLYEGRSSRWPSDQVTITHAGNVAGPSPFAGIPSWAPWVIAGGGAAVLIGGAAAIAYAVRKRRP